MVEISHFAGALTGTSTCVAVATPTCVAVATPSLSNKMLARPSAQSVIHFKRTKMLTPHVDLSSHQYPKYGLLAGFRWGFHHNIGSTKNPFICHKVQGLKHCPIVR